MIVRNITSNTLFPFLVLAVGILSACAETPPLSDTKDNETEKQAGSTKDSLVIIHSGEYQRTVELLTWYKKGHDSLRFSVVERSDWSDPDPPYALIDSREAMNYLKRYRNSGFFTKNYIRNDSLFIEKAKKAYADPKIEVYDYFDHDFILKTQETDETLKAIPTIRIVPEKCDLKKGEIVFVVAFQELEYTFVKENGVYKLDKIG